MISRFRRFKKQRSQKTSGLQTLVLSIFLGFLLTGLLVFLIVSNWKVAKQRIGISSQIQELEKEAQGLERKHLELQANIAKTETQEYLESIAREKFSLKKAGEKAVVVVPPEQKEEEVAPKQEKNLLQKILEKILVW